METMTVNRFEKLRSVIHFNDNTLHKTVDHPNHDRLHKIRPIEEHLNKLFLIMAAFEQRLSLDEQMCSTKIAHFMKQYLPNKPHKWGFMLYVLCSLSGYAHSFEIYSGKQDIQNLPDEPDLGIVGSYEELVADYEGEDISVTCWKDNKPFTLASTYVDSEPAETVSRFDKKLKEKVSIACPKIVKDYNAHMGGVDLMDSYLGLKSGRHGEEAIATQLGQDYLCLQTSRKDNFEIIHIKEDIYNIIGQKNDIEVLLVSRTSSPIEYTMTELDSDDEGFDDGLVQLTKDNPRLMKLLVEDKYFNEKVRQLGPLLLETLIEGIEAKTTEEVLIIKRVIDCLYDKNTTPSLNKELNL
ncbi:unnamed protein product [Arctia plantaginis]|uniref:PiggyBac transposable element-derived protein domain-containing protein n=1 Tax=Arctia plantaginis TaxID=874455 RepID=A0A8S0YTW8_ARCPL|nr:unnamed protein product [Arctia plantaginis]